MKQFLVKNRIWLLWSGFITAAILIKIFLFIHLYRIGFLGMSADEFSRTIKGYYWMKEPRLVYEGVWLPFGYYIDGLALFLWTDLFWSTKVAVLLFSFIMLVGIYFLGFGLFGTKRAGIFSVLVILFNPILCWYSYLPLVTMYHSCFVVWGMAFLALWFRNNKTIYLFFGSLSFLLASGFRFESWFFIVCYSLFVFILAVRAIKKSKKEALIYFLLSVIPVLFAVSWLGASVLRSGHLLDSHSDRNEYLQKSKSFLDVDASFLEKAGGIPKEFINPHFSIITILVVAAMVLYLFIRKSKAARRIHAGHFWLHCGTVLLSLLAICIYTGMTLPPMTRDRVALLYVLCMVPLAGWLFSIVFENDIYGKRIPPSARGVLRITVSIVIAAFLIFQINGVSRHPKNYLDHEIRLGFDLRKQLRQKPLAEGEKVMLQLQYWGYRGVVIGSNNPDMFVFDGPVNPLDNHGRKFSAIKEYHRSIFTLAKADIARYIRALGVRYVALQVPYARALVGAVPVKVISQQGPWVLCEVLE